MATVDSSGRATGVASGQATIFADYRGQRATRLLKVVPDYHGGWRGDWSVAACAEEGGWTGVCGEFPNGSLWLLILSITQNRDTVTGTTDFGDMKGPVTGTIRTTGHLVLTGTYTVAYEGITVEVTLSEWETTTTDNERMTGRFRVSFRAAGIQGSFRLDGDLRIVSKTSATPLGGVPGEGASVGDAMRWILRRR